MNAVACALTFLAGTGLLTYSIRGFRQMHREDQYIPAAPDNQAGTNTADLRTCRRIHARPARTEENR